MAKKKRNTNPAPVPTASISDEVFAAYGFRSVAAVAACLASYKNQYGHHIVYDRLTTQWFYGRGFSERQLHRVPDVTMEDELRRLFDTLQIPQQDPGK